MSCGPTGSILNRLPPRCINREKYRHNLGKYMMRDRIAVVSLISSCAKITLVVSLRGTFYFNLRNQTNRLPNWHLRAVLFTRFHKAQRSEHDSADMEYAYRGLHDRQPVRFTMATKFEGNAELCLGMDTRKIIFAG